MNGQQRVPENPTLYADALRRWVERARERTDTAEANAMAEEVETYLEELQVAEEELKVQNDELESALAEAESQRRRYRGLFDEAPLPYLTTDATGAILEANRQATTLLGLDPDRIAGKPISLYLVGDGELRARISRLAAGRAVQPWETEARPRNGASVPVEVTARGVSGPNDSVQIQWILRDIQGRLAAQDRERDLHREQAARTALEQVAARAQFLSEASGRLMGVLDSANVWRVAAELAGEHAVASLLVEVDPDTPESLHVRGVGGSPGGRRDLEPLLDRKLSLSSAAEQGIPARPIQLAIQRGEPEVVPAPDDPPDSGGACMVVPIRSSVRTLGALAVWVEPGARIGEELLVARNLADRVSLALESAAMFEEVVRSRRAAEEASTAEADFLSIVSHELRTPLTAIVSYAELLEDRAAEMPEKLGRYAHQIAAAADHQRQLVEQILAYKRVLREGDRLQPEPLDYRKVARAAVAMVRPQVEDRDVEVEEVVPSVPVHGACDRGKLQQILTNLLSNGVRHTRQGHVRLTLETRHQWVVFTVEDTGEGIPGEELPRIFDRFWRGRHGDRRGSGLGLTITRELVQRLRGEIEVESEPGVGTAFTVRIPRVAPGSGDQAVAPDEA